MILVVVHRKQAIIHIFIVKLQTMDIGLSSSQLGGRSNLLSLAGIVDDADSTRVIDLDNA